MILGVQKNLLHKNEEKMHQKNENEKKKNENAKFWITSMSNFDIDQMSSKFVQR